jgi:hypothetical protein
MKAGISISIPTPCHENWDAMTPESKGRFCGSCAKTVIDFTQMTDSQILTTISKATDNICGRVQTTQLKRTLTINESPRWQQPQFFKYAAATILMFKLSMPDVQAQKGKVVCKPTTEVKLPKVRMGIVKRPEPEKPIKLSEIMLGKIVAQPPAPQPNKMGEIAIFNNEIKTIEQIIKIVNRNDSEILMQASITTTVPNVEISKLSPGLFKVKMPVNTTPLLEIKAENFVTLSIGLNKNTDIIYLNAMKQDFGILSGDIVIVKNYPQLFKKSNIRLDIKEAKTKQLINDLNIIVTEMENEHIIKMEKKSNNSSVLLENIDAPIKYMVKINAPNYEERVFTINKAEYKKGKFVIPVFLNKIANKEVEELATLKLMPNFALPSSTIQIAINTPKAEPMMLALVSQNGKYLQTQKVQTTKGTQTAQLFINNNIKPQMAFVKLMNAKGKWIATEKIIIQ